MEEKQKKEIDIKGDLSWGSHLSAFYKTEEELVDVSVSCLRSGLENNEFCIWSIPDSIEVEKAKTALSKQIEKLNYYIDKGQLEVKNYRDYYIREGEFNASEMIDQWSKKEKEALSRNFSGLRVVGDGSDLLKEFTFKLSLYEREINENIGQLKMKAVCTYFLPGLDERSIFDMGTKHRLVFVKTRAEWVGYEASELVKAIGSRI